MKSWQASYCAFPSEDLKNLFLLDRISLGGPSTVGAAAGKQSTVVDPGLKGASEPQAFEVATAMQAVKVTTSLHTGQAWPWGQAAISGPLPLPSLMPLHLLTLQDNNEVVC